MYLSKKLIAGIVAVVAVAAGTTAFAAIPDGGGVIHGCYDKQSGTLRVTDTDTNSPKGCSNKEAALAWNQQGPKGDPGISGFQATSYRDVLWGPGSYAATASCPAGEKALGGGYALEEGSQFFTVDESHATATGGGWIVTGYASFPAYSHVDVYAYCANVS